MQYENRYHDVDKDMSRSIRPRFKITQNRKPWNAAATWLYMQAEFLAGPENPEVRHTVEQFAQRLRDTFQFKQERDGDIRRGAKNVDITTWEGEKNMYCGVNKANSTDGAALTITLAENT